MKAFFCENNIFFVNKISSGENNSSNVICNWIVGFPRDLLVYRSARQWFRAIWIHNDLPFFNAGSPASWLIRFCGWGWYLPSHFSFCTFVARCLAIQLKGFLGIGSPVHWLSQNSFAKHFKAIEVRNILSFCNVG